MDAENDVRRLCAKSHVEFTLSVKKIDEVCQDVRAFQDQVSDVQHIIDLRMARREAALRREEAARKAAEASRAAADKLLQQ